MTVLLKRLKALLSKSQFVRGVGLLAGGTALAQALTVLVSPLLTRLYSPGDFGVFAVYTAVLSVMVVAASLRYDIAIPLPEDTKSAVNLLCLSLVIVLSLSVLSGVVIWLWGEQIVKLIRISSLEPYLWLFPLGLLAAGVFESFNYWTMRKQAYAQIAKARLKQSLGLTLVQLAGGFLKAGPFGLMMGDVMGRGSGSGSLFITSWREDREMLRQISVKGICEVACRYRRFPFLTSWSAMLNSFVLQLPLLFLTFFYGPVIVGWFALAQRVIGLPLNWISSAVAQVYLAESARIRTDSPEEIKRLFWQTTKHMLRIGVPSVGLIALSAPWLFLIVFGEEWVEAGTYLRILAPMFLIDFVSNSIGGTTVVLERQDLQVIREIIRFALLAFVVILAGLYELSALMSIFMLSIAGSLGYLVHYMMSWLAIRNDLDRGVNQE